ncbi:hypothetical protein SVIO_026790 [Streptomyces violaceusniger]|uniref:glutamate--cysteine ligase n=1 Tax=Streptomyces violaceusniger TaxID=68280 RepID=A0A4D4KYU7_STRVO|nr:hypothetical protein SVIO_026790 [Streptomyces violaceusniger]
MAADLTVLRKVIEQANLTLVGRGLDPHREPPRVLDHPRYRAMESFFDREGPWGRDMMRRTASVQINLDSGEGSPASAATAPAGNSPTVSVPCLSPPSPTPRYETDGPPGGCPPGSTSGPGWMPVAPARPATTPTLAWPGPGMRSTHR